MIKIENFVSSLTLSQQLKELGVDQQSLFKWVHSQKNGWSVVKNMRQSVGGNEYAAFTAAELPVPYQINIDGKELIPVQVSKLFHIKINLVYLLSGNYLTHFIDANEANARAKLRAWMILNKTTWTIGSLNNDSAY